MYTTFHHGKEFLRQNHLVQEFPLSLPTEIMFIKVNEFNCNFITRRINQVLIVSLDAKTSTLKNDTDSNIFPSMIFILISKFG